jgi:hypothetical protein
MSKDLIVLVADAQQEHTLKTLLDKRRRSLSIRSIEYDIRSHPRRDSGVFREAHDFLAISQPPQYLHALVVLDREWAGAPGDAEDQRNSILQRLHASGWQSGTCEVIVCDPELEAWVWADSPNVQDVLRTTWDAIHKLAQEHGYWSSGAPKPSRPKELLEAILRQQNRPRTSAIFQELARRVSLKNCQDPAFNLFQQTLASWFAS